jgi:hypothetical protein
MRDAPDVLCDTLHATFELDHPPPDNLHPTTTLPDRSRTLRRTISYASIDTVRPSTSKGIRRSINEIAENLKRKSTKKKKKHSSTQDVPQNATHDLVSDSKALPDRKTAKRGKATVPLRDSSHSEEESVPAITDRLHSGVPSGWDSPLTFPDCKSDTVVDGLLFKEEEEAWEDCSVPARALGLGAHITAERQGTPRIPNIDIKDVQLDIRPTETDVTIWDGLRASVLFLMHSYRAGRLTRGVIPFHHSAHHVFKCRLFLRSTTHLYDSASLPDIRLVEMDCNTHSAGSRYAKPPTLQTAYEGAAPGRATNPSGLPNVSLAAGIHMDRMWCKILDDDGTWGWYRDAFVPLSPRLFDKMEYREFKLVSRVWVGESCVEGELTFGISMLLREVDMK